MRARAALATTAATRARLSYAQCAGRAVELRALARIDEQRRLADAELAPTAARRIGGDGASGDATLDDDVGDGGDEGGASVALATRRAVRNAFVVDGELVRSRCR